MLKTLGRCGRLAAVERKTLSRITANLKLIPIGYVFMPTYTKKLNPQKGSLVFIIPKKWLNRFGDITEVLVDESESQLIIKPLPQTKETKPTEMVTI